jgi:hypothetical protein
MSLMNSGTRAVALQLSQNVTVSAGGVRAYLVQQEAEITEVPAGAVSCVFDNVERQLIGHSAAAGTRIVPGQIVVVAAATAQTVQGPLTIEPGPAEPDASPATCT